MQFYWINHLAKDINVLKNILPKIKYSELEFGITAGVERILPDDEIFEFRDLKL